MISKLLIWSQTQTVKPLTLLKSGRKLRKKEKPIIIRINTH